MVLKSQRLYKATTIVGTHTYNYWSRKNVLISPKEDFDTSSFSKTNMDSYVSIDIGGCFNEDVEIFLTSDSFVLENATVGDIFEMIQVMKENNSKYRYNFRTNKIELKAYESNR